MSYTAVPTGEDGDNSQTSNSKLGLPIAENQRKTGRPPVTRILLEVVAVVCVVLPFSATFSHLYDPYVTTSDVWVSAPRFGMHHVAFMESKEYASNATLSDLTQLHETLHRWLDFAPTGRGLISIDASDRDGLQAPTIMKVPQGSETKEVYMLSVFHQLHCLTAIVEAYGRLRINNTVAQADWHFMHCVDYLRQSILCAADTTVEGSGNGWGATHVCKNFNDVKEWAEHRAVDITYTDTF